MDPTEQPELIPHEVPNSAVEGILDEQASNYASQNNLYFPTSVGCNGRSANRGNTSSNSTEHLLNGSNYLLQHDGSKPKIRMSKKSSDDLQQLPLTESGNQINQNELHYHNDCTSMSKVNSESGPSKEEKQRQNEEIVTSTITTETGAWEASFPYLSTELSMPGASFKSNELLADDSTEIAQYPASCSTKNFNCGSTFSNSNKLPLLHATAANSACFIDASSLRDEEEEMISYLNKDAHKINDPAVQQQPFNEFVHHNDEKSPTKELEEFHKSFARCKTKNNYSTNSTVVDLLQQPSNRTRSMSSNSGDDSPQQSDLDSTNNLSDEEKIRKREKTVGDLKNSSSLPELIDLETKLNLHEPAMHDSIQESDTFNEESDSSVLLSSSKPRHEQTRQMSYTGNYRENQLQTAQSVSTTQGPIRAGVYLHNDLSNTTDYSSSSPAPSLVWSDHEPRAMLDTGLKLHQTKECFKNNKIMPDTPHNSICSYEPLLSNSHSNHRGTSLSSSLSYHRDSGAYCSDATESPTPKARTPKRTKFDEENPIVSGGATFLDYFTKCESPSVRRKLDSCPIVSGGFVSLDFEPKHDMENGDKETKSKMRKHVPNIASWIVDMSDCKSECGKKSDIISDNLRDSAKFESRSSLTGSQKNGCGFYISLEDDERKPQEKLKVAQYGQKDKTFKTTSSDNAEKFVGNNNLFNMFIDIGGKKPTKGTEKTPTRNFDENLSNSLTCRNNQTDDGENSSVSIDSFKLRNKNNNMKPLLKDEECHNDSDGVREVDTVGDNNIVADNRRAAQAETRYQSDVSKRHSWQERNNTQTETIKNAGDYKRSTSLTSCNYVNENAGLMNIIDKLPIISKTSSLSVDSSLSPLDEFINSKSGNSTSSNISGITTAGENNGHARLKKRRCDAKINETFDKSSLASITDDLPSKDLSPASISDTEEMTFQQDEDDDLQLKQTQNVQLDNEMNRSSMVMTMETIIEAKESLTPNMNSKQKKGHTMETLHATIEKQKMLLETVNEVTEIGKCNYVKLSDMDKPINHDLISPDSMSKSLGYHRQINRVHRDDARARPHSWSMMHSSGNRLFNITSSVDNFRSLSRLFPNFSKEFSNSLPNDIILQQTDHMPTDMSVDTSLASSFSKSAMEESTISCRQPRRLGEDLLKMFLQEIATDMIVEVHDRRIKAHKCILRSRCQYFAAMLAGSNSQSVVTLQGYSFSAVHFALCHIYSGASHPPNGISLMELAALADLLGLEGLKEVTSYALKTNYCHNFHKPCSGCIDGILQVLPVALNHALDDLYRKCLRWTCRHYLKVWPTRQFAQLPQDILCRCRQQIVAYLTFETVLDVVLDCERLLRQLSAHRWGISCENIVRDIQDAAYAYIADHFASLIASDSFLSLGHDRSGQIPSLESLLLRTAASLTPDQACRSYQRITRLNTVLQAKVLQVPANLGELAKELQGLQEENLDWDPEYIRLVSELLSAVEQCLIRQCSPAMRVTAWQRMDLNLRKKIQTLARLTEPLDIRRSGRTVEKTSSLGKTTRNQDLVQIKMAIHAYSTRASMHGGTDIYRVPQADDVSKSTQSNERGRQQHDSKDFREGKILKSTSRAFVPQSRSTSQTNAGVECNDASKNKLNKRNQVNNEQVSNTTYKATEKSAVVALKATGKKPTSIATRLSDVRPRYLQPRKSQSKTNIVGPIRSATTSSVPVIYKTKGLHISSSDSSTYSSPANALQNANRIVTKLLNNETKISVGVGNAPPRARRANSAPQGKFTSSERCSDINMDSLAESMKSSSITNKTISNESLASSSNRRLSSNLLSLSKVKQANNSHYSSNYAVVKSSSSKVQKTQIYSNCSSAASSVPTSKSTTSFLSSIQPSKSATNKGTISYSKKTGSGGGGEGNPQDKKYTFLSAKSRKILAKRAERNKLQLQDELMMKTATATDAEKLHRNNNQTNDLLNKQRTTTTHSTAALKSSDCQNKSRNTTRSHIPTRRPNTLIIKKTSNDRSQHKVAPPPVRHAKRQDSSNESIAAIELLENIDNAPQCIISKLERSSTFCKENSDLGPGMNETLDLI